MAENSNQGFLSSIISNTENLIRGIIFLIFICLATSLSIVQTKKYLFPKKEVDLVEVTSSGFKVIFEDKKRELIYLNFHSSMLWKNEPIEIDPSDNVIIRASGRFNTAIHHLVNSAEKDIKPVYGWCGPEGVDESAIIRPADNKRTPYRILKDAKYGALLLQFVPNGSPVKDRPQEEYVRVVNDKYEINKNTFNQKGALYFAVNEIPLDREMKDVYIIKKSDDREYVKHRSLFEQRKAWDYIVKNNYWNLWFDDNIGAIFITIEINKN